MCVKFKDNETLKSQAGHALVQITANLRNLADLANTRQKFVSLNLVEMLVYTLKYFTSDSELMLNISRILSKLTLHADCCYELAKHESCFKSFIKLMIKHDAKQDLIVRVAFVIGNLTSRLEESRLKYFNEKYSIDTLINLLKYYINQPSSSSSAKNETSPANSSSLIACEPNECEDVLIKLIRVLANLALNETIGTSLASRQDLLDQLLIILDSATFNCEELILDSIITINNLTFYESDLINSNSQRIVDCKSSSSSPVYSNIQQQKK